MAQRNKGARRRKAFAEFKENQYNDSFSLSESEKRKILFKSVFKYVFIVLLTMIFIAVGFVISDALLNISQEPYNDTKTYLPANTTEAPTTLFSVESTREDESQSSTEVTQPSQITEQ